MSAPATKALSPAPVRITTPHSASSFARWNAASMSAMTASFKAFSLSGRLIVIVAMRFATSYVTNSRSMTASMALSLCSAYLR